MGTNFCLANDTFFCFPCLLVKQKINTQQQNIKNSLPYKIWCLVKKKGLNEDHQVYVILWRLFFLNLYYDTIFVTSLFHVSLCMHSSTHSKKLYLITIIFIVTEQIKGRILRGTIYFIHFLPAQRI